MEFIITHIYFEESVQDEILKVMKPISRTLYAETYNMSSKFLLCNKIDWYI